MDLPTYTNIWRIEKRLYKLYDFRLPMPLPINWIAVFAGITVPYIVLLIAIGLPFNHTLLWLYVLPPGVLTWLTTRPVLEGKRLPELVESQARYLTEPRTWVRLTPLARRTRWSCPLASGAVARRRDRAAAAMAPGAATASHGGDGERPAAAGGPWPGAAGRRPGPCRRSDRRSRFRVPVRSGTTGSRPAARRARPDTAEQRPASRCGQDPGDGRGGSGALALGPGAHGRPVRDLPRCPRPARIRHPAVFRSPRPVRSRRR